MADILQLESGDNLLLEDGASNLELEDAGAPPGSSIIPVIIRLLRGHSVAVAFVIWYLLQLRE